MQQFGLPVAFDAAKTDDFPGVQVETAVIDRNGAVIAKDHKLFDRNECRTGRAMPRVGRWQLGADDQTDKVGAIARAKLEAPTTRPARMTTARSQQS